MGETTMTGWTMRNTAFAAALVVSGAGAAQAATLTVTDTGTLGTGFEVPLSVAAFDTSLGTLTAVAWSLVIDWSAEVTLGNPNAYPILFVDGTAIGFDVFNTTDALGLAGVEGFVPLASFELLIKDSASFAPYLLPGESESSSAPSRVYSFAGSSADPTGLGTGNLQDWQDRGPLNLSVAPLTVIIASAYDEPDATGTLVDPPFTSSFTQDLTATLSVTYTYDPVTGGGGGPTDPVDPVPVVPLPAGLPLMLGGLTALAVLRRRRGA